MKYLDLGGLSAFKEVMIHYRLYFNSSVNPVSQHPHPMGPAQHMQGANADGKLDAIRADGKEGKRGQEKRAQRGP